MPEPLHFDVPEALTASHGSTPGGRAWLAGLPALVGGLLELWSLRPDGPFRNGMAGLVLPVVRAGGAPAVLKAQPLTPESADTAPGLRAWNGAGSVRLLEHDPATGGLLLERLDAARPLSSVPDGTEALEVLAGLLARLTAVPAPAGMRTLAGVAAAMTPDAPAAVSLLGREGDRALVRACAGAVADLLESPGDRLLHWDLHYDNVLAADREPWLAIDPEPLAGDPGFDLLPALDNRWEEVEASGDVARAVLRRFDLLTERLGLDRSRAAGWTLGRVLQNALWQVEDGDEVLDPVQVAIGSALLEHRY
ncbi:aminoglycoside phosphotransferase family protein [Nocardiopsis flavescens]|uniref:aminoglycoside phosphotransferase family protein n=1 Tax=Nocardiopsis flavescens TaxID=758803 RepID=UPI0036DCCECB